MEVAKLIMNVVNQKAHMTLSVKPFGCMPSSGVSDGVQSVITERYPEAIFCAVETSGDGAVNFYSRVQMFLFKARQRAQAEYADTLAKYGVTDEEVRAYVLGTRYAGTFYKAPHVVAGSAADIVHQVGPLIAAGGRLGRAKVHAARTLQSARSLVTETAPYVAAKVSEVAPYLPALARRIGLEAKDFLPAPSERERPGNESRTERSKSSGSSSTPSSSSPSASASSPATSST